MARATPIGETSLTQQKTLAIVPKVLAMLSCLCSFYIVVDVWRLPRSKRKAYHRILLGMSASDFASSLAWFFTTWPIPPDVLPVWGSRGTQTTCSVQGFFAQTSIATVLYSGCLSIYYYLVIRCGWSQRRLENSKIEWMMHIFPLCFAIGTSSTSVAMGLMNPIGWDCWIASVPIECEESWLNGGRTNCERGDNANLFQWLFFYIPLWITIFGVTTIMISIILKFWVQERHNEAWRRKSVGTPSSSIVRFRRGGSVLAAAGGRGSSIARRRSHLEEVVWQSLFYVGGFYFAWIFPTILRVHEVTADVVYYHWVQLSATFIPTQGICNLIVYLRPQYRRIKNQRRRREQQLLRNNELQPDQLETSSLNINDVRTQTSPVGDGVMNVSNTDKASSGAAATTTSTIETTVEILENDCEIREQSEVDNIGLYPLAEYDLEDVEDHQDDHHVEPNGALHDRSSGSPPSRMVESKPQGRVSFAETSDDVVSGVSPAEAEPQSSTSFQRLFRGIGHRRNSNSTANSPSASCDGSAGRRRRFRQGRRQSSGSGSTPSSGRLSSITRWIDGTVRDLSKAIQVGDGGDGGVLVSGRSRHALSGHDASADDMIHYNDGSRPVTVAAAAAVVAKEHADLDDHDDGDSGGEQQPQPSDGANIEKQVHGSTDR